MTAGLRKDASGSSMFGTITTASGSVTDRFFVGSNINALAYAANDLGFGPHSFYYLRGSSSGFATLGTISLSGAVKDRFGVGNNFFALSSAE